MPPPLARLQAAAAADAEGGTGSFAELEREMGSSTVVEFRDIQFIRLVGSSAYGKTYLGRLHECDVACKVLLSAADPSAITGEALPVLFVGSRVWTVVGVCLFAYGLLAGQQRNTRMSAVVRRGGSASSTIAAPTCRWVHTGCIHLRPTADYESAVALLPDQLERLERQAAMMGALRHENIVQVRECWPGLLGVPSRGAASA